MPTGPVDLPPPISGDEEQEALVTRVKEMQKQRLETREAWHRFADVEGGGVRDPTRQTALLLQRFLDNIESLVAQVGPSLIVDPQLQYVVNEIKNLQKQHKEWRDAWRVWCDTEGRGLRDPSRHDSAFLQRFLQAHGHLPGRNGIAAGGLANGGLAAASSVSTGVPGATAFMGMPGFYGYPGVSAMGGMSPTGYPAASATDPGSLGTQTTQLALPAPQTAAQAVPQPSANPFGAYQQMMAAYGAMGYGGFAGYGGTGAAALASYPGYAGMAGYAGYPLSAYGMGAYGAMPSSSTAGAAAASVASLSSLYSAYGMMPGYTADPTAVAAAYGAANPTAYAAAWSAAMGGTAAMAGAMGSAAGIPTATGVGATELDASPVEVLAERVKQAQRSSVAWKDAWQKLCDNVGGGIRDPSRQSVTVLRAYLEATEKAPHTIHAHLSLTPMRAINAELIKQVKSAQHSSDMVKERWHRLCDSEGGGCRDPNLHEESFLRSFLASASEELPENNHKRPADVEDPPEETTSKRHCG